MITFETFFIKTEAIFKGCKKPKRKPDYISYYTDYWTDEKKISSQYWYGENKKGKYVIRESEHWVKMKKLNKNSQIKNIKSVATCLWHFKGKEAFEKKIEKKQKEVWHIPEYAITLKGQKMICGKAYLKNFKML